MFVLVFFLVCFCVFFCVFRVFDAVMFLFGFVVCLGCFRCFYDISMF